jgi:probable rRNA maturation factor
LSIKVYYDKIKLRVNRSGEIKKFLEKVIREEKRIPGDLNFIFTNDKKLIDINREFLDHDYYTDVITFNYSEGIIINGEIYVSADTIRRNASHYNVSVKEELLRVMIHGVLHLCGYRDESKENREIMIKRQEEKLKEFIKEC